GRQLQGRAGLLLTDVQQPVADVLWSHAHNITASLCGVEQKLDRKAGARSKLVVATKRCNLFLAPCAKTLPFLWDLSPDVSCRVVHDHVDRQRKLHKGA